MGLVPVYNILHVDPRGLPWLRSSDSRRLDIQNYDLSRYFGIGVYVGQSRTAWVHRLGRLSRDGRDRLSPVIVPTDKTRATDRNDDRGRDDGAQLLPVDPEPLRVCVYFLFWSALNRGLFEITLELYARCVRRLSRHMFVECNHERP